MKTRHDDTERPPTGGSWKSFYRGKKFKPADPELWKAVRHVCREEFAAFAGTPWEELYERQAETHTKNLANERAARKVYRALRDEMLRASKFVATNDGRGRASSFLRWWVPQFVDPLLKHASMDHKVDWDKDDPLLDGRAAVAHIWDTYDMLGLRRRSDGHPRMLDYREFAIVSLLLGSKPHFPADIESVTVAGAIGAERQRMALSVKEHGQRWHDEGGPLKIPRGPEKQKPRRTSKR